MLNPTFKLKTRDFTKNFFDTTERCVNKNLRHFALYVRKVARSSIKPANKHSKATQAAFIKGPKGEVYSRPGDPPLSKMGLLKDNIFSVEDKARKSFLVGAEKLNRPSKAPEVLELGGKMLVKTGKGIHQKVVAKYMRKRPYMGPALQKSLGALPRIFKDSLVSHTFDATLVA